jgi:hypothetical protein
MVPAGAEHHHVALLGIADALSLQRLLVVVQRDGVADLQLVDAFNAATSIRMPRVKNDPTL